MTDNFKDRLSILMKKKRSVLCVGLDPALPSQREKETIPREYCGKDENETRLDFCLKIIEQISNYAVAVKVNDQYVKGFTSREHRMLTEYAREKMLVAIEDCKLGDISDTAESNLFWMNNWRYDAITVNPLPGNLKQITDVAHSFDPPIGIIVLTLMSNPEAVKYFKNASVSGMQLYVAIAKEVKEYDVDGCVVGATGHVTEDDIKTVRRIVGEDKIFLIPGVGKQRGEPEKVIRAGGANLLINVGRDIIYSNNPRRKAEEYKKILNEYILKKKL